CVKQRARRRISRHVRLVVADRRRGELGLDDLQNWTEQLLPTIGTANPDREKIGADEHVRNVSEVRKQSGDACIIDLRRRWVPPTRASVQAARDEADRPRVGCRLGSDRSSEGLAQTRLRVPYLSPIGRRTGTPGPRKLESEPTVPPPEREVESAVKL